MVAAQLKLTSSPYRKLSFEQIHHTLQLGSGPPPSGPTWSGQRSPPREYEGWTARDNVDMARASWTARTEDSPQLAYVQYDGYGRPAPVQPTSDIGASDSVPARDKFIRSEMQNGVSREDAEAKWRRHSFSTWANTRENQYVPGRSGPRYED